MIYVCVCVCLYFIINLINREDLGNWTSCSLLHDALLSIISRLTLLASYLTFTLLPTSHLKSPVPLNSLSSTTINQGFSMHKTTSKERTSRQTPVPDVILDASRYSENIILMLTCSDVFEGRRE